jgi:hypothetical protein
MVHLSEESYAKFKELSDKEGHHYESDVDMRQSANSLVGFIDTLLKMDWEEKQLVARLTTEPKGFAMTGDGRSCPLCRHYQGDAQMWYDKWGLKCMNCQEAVNKRLIPGYVFRDYKNEKHITDSGLASKVGLHVATIRKWARQGKIKARTLPKSTTLVFLRKENPDLGTIVEAELAAKKTTS